MRTLSIRLALMSSLLAMPALAQTLPGSAFAEHPESTIVPPLPAPALDDNASVEDFLRAAEHALAADRIGEAQESMERAQTRLLDRSVPLYQTDVPSAQPAVKLISQGLQALAAGDRETCLRMIKAAKAEASKSP